MTLAEWGLGCHCLERQLFLIHTLTHHQQWSINHVMTHKSDKEGKKRTMKMKKKEPDPTHLVCSWEKQQSEEWMAEAKPHHHDLVYGKRTFYGLTRVLFRQASWFIGGQCMPILFINFGELPKSPSHNSTVLSYNPQSSEEKYILW